MIEKLNDEDILSDTRIIPKINEIIELLNGDIESNRGISLTDFIKLLRVNVHDKKTLINGEEYISIFQFNLVLEALETRMKGKA